MYPNEYCTPCRSEETIVEVTPPPVCEGETCAEITDAKCVRYSGPDIEELNITSGTNLNDIISLVSEILCGCTTEPEITVVTTCNGATITITNPISTIDLYAVEYKEDTASTWTTITSLPGDLVFSITGLIESTDYNFRVKRVCNNTLSSNWEVADVSTIACI